MRKSSIPEPCEVLKEYMEEYRVTVEQLSADTNLPLRMVKQVLNGKVSISAYLSLHLAKYFKTAPEYWVNLQVAYERPRLSAVLKGIPKAKKPRGGRRARVEDKEQPPKKTRERPKASKSPQEDEPPKKTRGRPASPKKALDAAAPKRSRGKAASSKKDQQEDGAPKRPRGRKPSPAAKTEAGAAAPKRGRPRTNKTIKADSSDAAEPSPKRIKTILIKRPKPEKNADAPVPQEEFFGLDRTPSANESIGSSDLPAMKDDCTLGIPAIEDSTE
jgi:addiction module HigA family antidote